eukprot:252782_1
MVSMRKILLGVCAVIIGSIVIISLVGTGKIRTPLSDYSKFVDTPIADGGRLTINLSLGGKVPKVTVVETSTTGTLQKLQDVSELAKKDALMFIHNRRVIADYSRPLGNYGIKNGDTVHYLLGLGGTAQTVYVKVPGDDGRRMKLRVGGSTYASQIKKTVRTELGLEKDYPMDLLPGNTILK